MLAGTLFDDDQVALCADEVPVVSWSRHREWRSPRCTAGVTVTMRQASTHGPRAGEVHVRRAAASLVCFVNFFRPFEFTRPLWRGFLPVERAC